MKAVVLAAGEGQRLRPLTFTRSKHMLPVGGKPILEHILLTLKEAGIKSIIIVVHYKAKKIKEYFRDGSWLGLKIDYVFQEEIGGTADAFGTVEKYFDDDFLAVYGDLLITSKAVKDVISFHRKAKSAVTLTALHVTYPEYYGVLEIREQKIINVIEKPSPEIAIDKPINAGLYVFSPEIFSTIKQTEPSPRGEREITDSIRMLIKAKKRVLAATISSDDWLDVGKPWDLLEANARLLNKMTPEKRGEIEENAHLNGSVFFSEHAKIRSGAYIEGPVFIGEGSDIGPNCYIRPCTSIGKNVRIGNACEIKNSIIMDGVHIGHLSYVGDSVIGEACNLGAGFISANVRFDNGTVKARIRGNVVNSDRKKVGVFMGDNAKTGVGALFMPGVTVGCNTWIGPNIVVCKDAPSNIILILKQQIEESNR